MPLPVARERADDHSRKVLPRSASGLPMVSSCTYVCRVGGSPGSHPTTTRSWSSSQKRMTAKRKPLILGCRAILEMPVKRACFAKVFDGVVAPLLLPFFRRNRLGTSSCSSRSPRSQASVAIALGIGEGSPRQWKSSADPGFVPLARDHRFRIVTADSASGAEIGHDRPESPVTFARNPRSRWSGIRNTLPLCAVVVLLAGAARRLLASRLRSPRGALDRESH